MKILISPCLNIVEDRLETLAKLRQGILHPRRHLTKIVTKKETICFQLPKLFCKGTFRNLPNLTAKLSEASEIVPIMAFVILMPIYQRSSILYFPPSNFCTVEIVLQRFTADSDFLIFLISIPYHHNLFHAELKGTSKKYSTFISAVVCYNDANGTVVCEFASLPAHNSLG